MPVRLCTCSRSITSARSRANDCSIDDLAGADVAIRTRHLGREEQLLAILELADQPTDHLFRATIGRRSVDDGTTELGQAFQHLATRGDFGVGVDAKLVGAETDDGIFSPVDGMGFVSIGTFAADALAVAALLAAPSAAINAAPIPPSATAAPVKAPALSASRREKNVLMVRSSIWRAVHRRPRAQCTPAVRLVAWDAPW